METPKSGLSKASASPSPTASASTSATTPNGGQIGTPGNSTNSRRPPRKSTLTQQQKNQKRQRATQDQLVTLEVEFNKNATPTAATRERIASEINMTERSVQIWFQNRRAKIKLLAKKSIETGEDCDAIPDSMRQYLAQQAMELGKPLSRAYLGAPGMGYGPGIMFGSDAHQPQKVVIHHFQCRSLSIGTWRRVGQNAMDLVIFYSLGATPCLTYYINNEAAGYKVEFPFHFIKNINLENGQSDNGMPARPAGLVVELNRPPNFYMDSNNQGGFAQCGDFTEDQQASKVLVHHLGGDPHTLSGQLAKLTVMDQFQNRHNPMYNAETSAIAASAPVSPMFHRPASQPNAMAPPGIPVFRENGFGSLHPTRAMGHKRQRSRSVPTIPNFDYMNHPMPSFHIQQPSTTITDPSIFAPIPQHLHNLSPNGAPLGLRIDTAASYGVDFRQYPQSAATTASASDFASPSLFHAQPASVAGDNHSMAGDLHGGYGFLHSPMLEAAQLAGHPSASPLSALSLAHSPASAVDPIIANQSPPLGNIQRPASAADFMSMNNGDHQHMSVLNDDNFMGDMYGANKVGQLNLPYRATEQQGQSPQQHNSMLHGSAIDDELDMNSMIDFGIDPSQLESGHM